MAGFVLLAYAAVLLAFAPRLLAIRLWPERAPRLGVLMWQATALGALAAVVLAGLVWAAPSSPFAHAVAWALRLCLRQPHPPAGIADVGASAAPAALSVLGVGLLLIAVSRLLVAVAAVAVVTRRERRRQIRLLGVVGRPTGAPDTYVIDHPVPAAYCVSGRRPRVVVTAGALAALAPAELDAVIAHERAHLRGRHGWVIGGFDVLRRAYPWIPGLRTAYGSSRLLLEMAADDAAAKRCSRSTVADALAAVAASGPIAAGALAAGGPTAHRRVERLLRPDTGISPVSRAGSVVLALLLAVVPFSLSVAPAFNGAAWGACPF